MPLVLGLRAIVDALPHQDVLELVDFKDVVFAGWDIEKGDVYSCAKYLKIAPTDIIEQLKGELKIADEVIDDAFRSVEDLFFSGAVRKVSVESVKELAKDIEINLN